MLDQAMMQEATWNLPGHFLPLGPAAEPGLLAALAPFLDGAALCKHASQSANGRLCGWCTNNDVAVH